ncbi:hypothetical protein HRbin37_01421 [bacterium HR37]|nr:hypothetical protein HRbin37_01421 [bacterium HR37]
MKRKVVVQWLIKANDDLKTSEILLKSEDIPTGAVCFHAQQAVEKFLKAYLTNIDVRTGKTHDIAKLLNMCIQHDKDFEKLNREKLEKLTFYAVEIRYPEEFYTPTTEEAKEAFELALTVKEFISKKLQIDIKEYKSEDETP